MSRKIALGGVFAALAVTVMLLGGVIPVAVYISPMLASLPLVLLRPRLGLRLSVGWYAVVAALALLLCPDRECALLFAVLGYYPLLRPTFERLPPILRFFCKLALFVAALAVMYALLLLVFRVPALLAELRELQIAMGIVLVLLGGVTFLLYDLLIGRMQTRLRRK